MTIRQFRKLEGDHEREEWERFEEVESWFSGLKSEIDKIEYNGHFGTNFFFRLTHKKESVMDSDAKKVFSILSEKLR